MNLCSTELSRLTLCCLVAVIVQTAISLSPAWGIPLDVEEATDAPSGDFRNAWTFNLGIADFVGQVDLGTNVVRGSLLGECVQTTFVDCNNASGDGQDSFLLEIPAGLMATSLVATTSNGSGPAGFQPRLEFFDENFQIEVFESLAPLNNTSANHLLSPAGPYIYSVTVFASAADTTGPYSFGYELTLLVVPEPASATLLAGYGLVLLTRRRLV